MRAWDFSAVVYNGAIYCDDPSCLPPGVTSSDDDVSPIFAGSETDRPSHCESCGAPVDEETLTDDGVEYVLDAAREALQRPRAERNRIMPKPGTGEDHPSHRYWHGSRHVDIVRHWLTHVTGRNERERRFLELFDYFTKGKP